MLASGAVRHAYDLKFAGLISCGMGGNLDNQQVTSPPSLKKPCQYTCNPLNYSSSVRDALLPTVDVHSVKELSGTVYVLGINPKTNLAESAEGIKYL